MTYIGIDYSTNAIDLVRLPELDPTQPHWDHLALDGDDAFERIRRVPWEMPGPGWWKTVTAVGIEEPGGKYAYGKLMRVQGAIVACLPDDLLVAPYQARLWRKLVGLPGGASKKQVKQWVLGQLPEGHQAASTWPQDAFDAYCLARAVASQVRHE